MTETLKGRIREDVNQARKAGEREKVSVLTMLLSEVHNREIDLGRELGDAEVETAVVSAIKRRREAAEMMRLGGREDRAQEEESQARVLQSYLPPQLGEDEVRALVRAAVEAGAGNVGAVMKQVAPQVKGKFEGRLLNQIVQSELASQRT